MRARSESSSRRSGQAGFFLIEAMVALLIFALGILGLVAMGGTAVASQSDAQYRTEATAIADAIAGEIALNVARLPAPPLTSAQVKAASLLTFAHHPAGGNCVFGGAPTANVSVAGARRLRRQRDSRHPGIAGSDHGQPANPDQRRRDVQPGRDHLVLADRERQRDAPAHAGDLRQLRPAMQPRLRHRSSQRRERGVSLVEILIGVTIGVIGILAIFQTVAVWNKHSQTTTSGGDAQIAGTLALFNLERDLKQAGHGFSTALLQVMGCR